MLFKMIQKSPCVIYDLYKSRFLLSGVGKVEILNKVSFLHTFYLPTFAILAPSQG